MNKINQKVELAANFLIVVVALLLIGVLAQRYFFSSPVSANQQARVQPTVGKKVNLENVNFSESPKTVVLALQTTCHFCNESAPFYKKMLEEAKGKNIRFVAVFPTPVADSQKHLSELGITGFEVKQAPITALDASGTPTLILTNSKGEVEKFWVGKLPSEKESEVLSQLNS
jgi:thiol-disulfide isomerase/thioredoxin